MSIVRLNVNKGRVLAETVLYDRLRIINRQDPTVSPYVEILIDVLDNSTNVSDVLFLSQPALLVNQPGCDSRVVSSGFRE